MTYKKLDTMIKGFHVWQNEEGKYSSEVQDGYQWFNTIAELEADIEMMEQWSKGNAYVGDDGWVLSREFVDSNEIVKDPFGVGNLAKYVEDFNYYLASVCSPAKYVEMDLNEVIFINDLIREQACWKVADGFLTKAMAHKLIHSWFDFLHRFKKHVDKYYKKTA